LIGKVIEQLLPTISENAIQIGITGPPSAGKSTLIEAIGSLHVAAGNKLAVLAIDPTSPESGGSILGDKTRMEALSRHELAWVRPNPARGHLGGATPYTREERVLCQAAGYDTVLIETVGVGQSETEISDMVDLTVLVLPPASGDDLQGVKRGIVEMADVILINKADGDLMPAAEQARQHYTQALHLFPARDDGWQVPVLSVSAQSGYGLEHVWPCFFEFLHAAQASGALLAKRKEQRRVWFQNCMGLAWRQALYQSQYAAGFVEAEHLAAEGKGWPPTLAQEQIQKIIGNLT
jgi:LAO/AO transport system kinase